MPNPEATPRTEVPQAARPVTQPNWEPIERLIRKWVLTENLVARVGIIVLFFGVAFFLKYAIDHGWLPIELRLVASALGGLSLLAGGWRLRQTRRDYALVLQGGGAGIVYLTAFAAVDLYHLIAVGPGLAEMVVLVALTATLAVLQDARSLAVLATIGGFLAPPLVSDVGSHIGLFSYYLVLDAGILAIAWFKAWRALNLLGFLFTFIGGAVWGAAFYRPEYFASTEPFLTAFFLLYVAVPVLFAERQSPNLRGVVDGTLVFGVPLLAFGLQSALVRDFEYGLAWSALAVGVFYATLAWALWRRRGESLRMLVEAFLALAVAFGTLAIPFVFDGQWTGTAWALEGAALVWVGVRQRRALARWSGVAIQLAAGGAFLVAADVPTADLPILNSFYLGALMVSLSGLFMAWYLDRHRLLVNAPERALSVAALGWGLLWWVGAGGIEIGRHVAVGDQHAALLAFFGGSAVLLTDARRRLAWVAARFPPLLLLPVMCLIALAVFAAPIVAHPLARWGSVAWAVAFIAKYWVLWRAGKEWTDDLAGLWHTGTLWLAVFLASWELAWGAEQVLPGNPTWTLIAWVLVPLATILVVPTLARLLEWPLRRFRSSYMGPGSVPLVAAVAIWVLSTCSRLGDPAPLPYLPVLNPLEIMQCAALAGLAWWKWTERSIVTQPWHRLGWAILAFITLNGIVARATHFIGAVPFEWTVLWTSARFQTAVSITWTAVALLVMLAATRWQRRAEWSAGAVLLGCAVVKLFSVDLEGVETVARIVSFLVVGLLLLAIGYLSPRPPRAGQELAEQHR